jgi:sugar phosphate isomerase/epimerase
MKIGCCAYSYRKYLTAGEMTLEKFVDIVSDLGVQGVELTSYYFPSTDAAYLHSLKRHCLVRGVAVSGAAVGSKLTLASDEERAAEIRMVKDWLWNARELGAPELRVFAGATPEGHTDDEAFGWAVAALKECVPVAEEAGVVMALENHGGITTTSAQVIALIKAVDSPWLQVNLDTGNYGLDPDVDPYEGMRRVAALSVTAHHKVSMRTPDGSKRVDVEQVVSTLRAADYRGFLNIEYEEDADPMTGVPRVVEEIRSALANG